MGCITPLNASVYQYPVVSCLTFVVLHDELHLTILQVRVIVLNILFQCVTGFFYRHQPSIYVAQRTGGACGLHTPPVASLCIRKPFVMKSLRLFAYLSFFRLYAHHLQVL